MTKCLALQEGASETYLEKACPQDGEEKARLRDGQEKVYPRDGQETPLLRAVSWRRGFSNSLLKKGASRRRSQSV